ncbi:MAG: hypothetical protein ABI665_07755, partial [Vicinamibacterales bacterium]
MTRSTLWRMSQAVALAAAVVLAAPFTGQVISWLRGSFPRQLAPIVSGGVALAVVAALGAAVV